MRRMAPPHPVLPRRLFAIILLLLTAILMPGGAPPLIAATAQASRVPEAVQDLAYGEVLYHYFLDDDFTTLVHLQTALQRNRIMHHRDEAALLEGSLLLSYGLLEEAQALFDRLLAQNPDESLRHRVWLRLATLHHRRKQPAAAREALLHVDAHRLPAPRRDAYHLLSARVLMDLGEPAAAVSHLTRIRGEPRLAAYARFNLAVALERQGKDDDASGDTSGRTLLDELGLLVSDDPEILAIRDKANLALGYLHLREERPAQAREALLRVRVDGLDTAPALLGLGWAALGSGDSGRIDLALPYWQRLLDRHDPAETAVQEALLAIPYALAEAGDLARAARRYETAVSAFARERQRLGDLETRIREQGIGRLLLGIPDIPGGIPETTGRDTPRGGYWEPAGVPADIRDRELTRLLAGSEFQAVLQNLRELHFLARALATWRRSIATFRDMLALRRDTYAARLPRIEGALGAMDLASLQRQRDALATRLTDIEQREDSAALADATALRLAARLEKVRRLLARHPDTPRLARQRERLRLLEGVHAWHLAQAYKPRLWSLRKALKGLDRALDEAAARQRQVTRARDEAPRGFAGQDRRIAALEKRISVLQVRIDAARSRHEAYLQHLVLTVLERRLTRLRAFETQARYGLARLYDLAAESREQPEAGP